MAGWWVLLVVAAIFVVIGIIIGIIGVDDGSTGMGCGGFTLTVISGVLVYASLIHLFFPGWPLGPANAHSAPISGPTVSSPSKCGTHYAYDSLVDLGTSWSVQYKTSSQNNAPTPLTVTFRSNVDTTVTVTDNLGVTVSGGVSMLSVITASVRTSVNKSVTQSITLQVGVDDQYIVPPHSIAHANYGVRVQVVSGHLHTTKDSCDQISWGKVITYVPIDSGWCIWLNAETPCPSITTNM